MAQRKRIGRPPKEDREELLDQRIASGYTKAERLELEELAHDDRVSLSEYIRRIVVRYLERRRKR